jgi:hypothetical protein
MITLILIAALAAALAWVAWPGLVMDVPADFEM